MSVATVEFVCTEPHHEQFVQLLSTPQLRPHLVNKLAPLKLPLAEVQDLVAQTLEALWRRRNDVDRPDNLARLLGLAGTILAAKLVDYFRHKAVTTARIVDAPPLPGEAREQGAVLRGKDQPNYVEELRPPRSITPEDRLEAKQRMEVVNDLARKVGLTEDLVEVMQAIDCGEMTIEQAAAQRKITGNALRQRIHKVRSKLRAAWAKHAAIRGTTLLVLLMLAMLLLYAFALAGGRRGEPPQHQPQRTVTPHEPRGESPSLLEWQQEGDKPSAR